MKIYLHRRQDCPTWEGPDMWDILVDMLEKGVFLGVGWEK